VAKKYGGGVQRAVGSDDIRRAVSVEIADTDSQDVIDEPRAESSESPIAVAGDEAQRVGACCHKPEVAADRFSGDGRWIRADGNCNRATKSTGAVVQKDVDCSLIILVLDRHIRLIVAVEIANRH